MQQATLLILLAVSAPVDDQAQRIAGAFKAGDVLTSASYLSSIANRHPQYLPALSTQFQKLNLPGSVPLLIESRLTAVKNGQSARLLTISLGEMSLVGQGIVARIDAALASVRSDPIRRESAKSLDEFHDAFWALNAARNQIRELHATTAYWKEVTRRFPRRSIARLPEAIRGRVVAASAAETHDQVEQLIKQLDKREMELRLARLMLAVKALEQQSDLGQRILAAGYWREDQETLTRFLSATEQPTLRTSNLSNKELLSYVTANARYARQLAGELTGKAESLNQALFWWVRGRYGIGTELFGLAKPALASQQGNGLHVIMPTERPEPTDPQSLQRQPAPQFSRRHHYSWAVGQRQYAVALAPQIQRVPVLTGFR